jgi:tRNA-Thr(GGU) m(6)t(6)A37 methyltransferase TsaA
METLRNACPGMLGLGLLLVACRAAMGGGTPVTFQLRPIGVVEKGDGATRLRIEEPYRPALKGLDGFSHVWVFWWFDRNDTPRKRGILQVHPRGNRANPLTGVFATRAPVRPNLIAMTLCKIRRIEDGAVEIEGIDAFDETPVLDLKPYIPRIDQPADQARLPAWVNR